MSFLSVALASKRKMKTMHFNDLLPEISVHDTFMVNMPAGTISMVDDPSGSLTLYSDLILLSLHGC